MGNEVLDGKTCVTFPDNMEMEGKKKEEKKSLQTQLRSHPDDNYPVL